MFEACLSYFWVQIDLDQNLYDDSKNIELSEKEIEKIDKKLINKPINMSSFELNEQKSTSIINRINYCTEFPPN